MLRLLILCGSLHLVQSATSTPYFLSPSPSVLASRKSSSSTSNATVTVSPARTSPRATEVKISAVEVEHKLEKQEDLLPAVVQTSRATRIASATSASTAIKASPSTKPTLAALPVQNAATLPTAAAPVVVQLANATIALEKAPVEAHEGTTAATDPVSTTAAPAKKKWTRAKIVFLVVFGIASALVLVMLVTTLVFNWKAPKPQYLHR